MKKKNDLVIEPQRGQTYNREGRWAVYQYGTYPRSSVLAGQTMRSFIDGGFESPEAAKEKYPEAEISEHSRYQPPSLSHLPDEEGDLY